MYHPDTFMTYRDTDLLTSLIYYLLGKMKQTSHSKIKRSGAICDQTIQFLYHQLLYKSIHFHDKKQQILEKHPQRTTYTKQFIRVCAVPILLSLVHHLQKNMIINPIELCNPSVVADPGGALPSVPPPPKKKNPN